MLNRDTLELKLCLQIENCIKTSATLVKPHPFSLWQDDKLIVVREKLKIMSNAYYDFLHGCIRREKEERDQNPLKFPISLYRSIQSAEEELKEEEKKIKELKESFEIKKENIKNKKTARAERVWHERESKAAKFEMAMEERDRNFKKCFANYAIIKEKYNKKQQEIASHCCGIAIFTSKKLLLESARLEQMMNDAEMELKNVVDASNNEILMPLESRALTPLSELIEKEEKEYLATLNVMEKKLDETKKILVTLYSNKSRLESEYNNKVAYPTMVAYLKTYDAYNKLRNVIEDLCDKSGAEKNALIDSSLIQLREMVLKPYSTFEDLLTILRCPEFSSDYLLGVYHSLQKLNEVEQKKFLEKKLEIKPEVKLAVKPRPIPNPKPEFFTSKRFSSSEFKNSLDRLKKLRESALELNEMLNKNNI